MSSRTTTGHSSFACCQFSGARQRLALPVEEVLRIHDDRREAPHICGLLGLVRAESSRRVLELRGPGAPHFLLVDCPVALATYSVEQVLPRSAGQGGPFTQAIIEGENELILLLDATRLQHELLRLAERAGDTEREVNP